MPLYQISRRSEGFLCLIIGIFGICLGFLSLFNEAVFNYKSISGEGTIVAVKHFEQAHIPYEVDVKLTIPGSREENHFFKTSQVYAVGDKFKVLYDPKNPYDVRSATSTFNIKSMDLVLMIVGIYLLALGWVRVR